MFMDFANPRQAFTLILNVVPKESVIYFRVLVAVMIGSCNCNYMYLIL